MTLTTECKLGKECKVFKRLNEYRDMVEDSYHTQYTQNEVVEMLEAVIDGVDILK